MIAHHVYADELNERGNKTRNGKNKRLAQELGIVVAKDMFETYLDVENQGPMFNWHSYSSSVARHASIQVPLYYRHSPKNIEELKVIAHESAAIEWKNLVSSHTDLPKAKYPYKELISAFEREFTSNRINIALKEYKYSLKFDVNATNIDAVKLEFYKQLDVEKARRDSLSNLEYRINEQFELTDQQKAKEDLSKYINEFFDNL
jgi:hypothetical protein